MVSVLPFVTLVTHRIEPNNLPHICKLVCIVACDVNLCSHVNTIKCVISLV